VAVGNAEDVSNVITMISPDETPIFSSFGRSRATGVIHHWLEDSLSAPGPNARPEGFTFSLLSPPPRVDKFNYTQILDKGYEVTATQEAVLKHGVDTEIGRAMQKASRELALDIEWALINNGAPVLQTGTDMTRKMGGILSYILPANVDSTTTAFTETALADAIQKAWQNGGNPRRVFMSGTNKRAASNFSNSERQRDQKSKRLTRTIRVYESDFGEVEFVPHRFIPDTTVLIIDPAFCKVSYLRPIHKEIPAHTKDTKTGELVGELTLEVRAGGAHAALTAIGTGGGD
jgi:hypothetical protein